MIHLVWLYNLVVKLMGFSDLLRSLCGKTAHECTWCWLQFSGFTKRQSVALRHRRILNSTPNPFGSWRTARLSAKIRQLEDVTLRIQIFPVEKVHPEMLLDCTLTDPRDLWWFMARQKWTGWFSHLRPYGNFGPWQAVTNIFGWQC